MKTLVLALGMVLLLGLGRAGAQVIVSGPPGPWGGYYPAPVYPYPAYPYPGYALPLYPGPYPYPLPPAPSFGFGRGGIYGHVFVGRGDGVTAYTLPGYRDWYR